MCARNARLGHLLVVDDQLDCEVLARLKAELTKAGMQLALSARPSCRTLQLGICSLAAAQQDGPAQVQVQQDLWQHTIYHRQADSSQDDVIHHEHIKCSIKAVEACRFSSGQQHHGIYLNSAKLSTSSAQQQHMLQEQDRQ